MMAASRARASSSSNPVSSNSGRPTSSRSLARFAHPEDDPDRLRQQASGHESQHLARGPVEPLGVVHEAHERPLGGNLGQQTKRPKANQEGIGCISEREAQRHPQRVLLGPGKCRKLADHRRAQLMQPRERQLHLSLHACQLDDSKPRSLPCGVAQKGRLSDTGLTTNDQDRALPPSHILQQPIQHLALAGPAPEPRLALSGHSPRKPRRPRIRPSSRTPEGSLPGGTLASAPAHL